MLNFLTAPFLAKTFGGLLAATVLLSVFLHFNAKAARAERDLAVTERRIAEASLEEEQKARLNLAEKVIETNERLVEQQRKSAELALSLHEKQFQIAESSRTSMEQADAIREKEDANECGFDTRGVR